MSTCGVSKDFSSHFPNPWAVKVLDGDEGQIAIVIAKPLFEALDATDYLDATRVK